MTSRFHQPGQAEGRSHVSGSAYWIVLPRRWRSALATPMSVVRSRLRLPRRSIGVFIAADIAADCTCVNIRADSTKKARVERVRREHAWTAPGDVDLVAPLDSVTT